MTQDARDTMPDPVADLDPGRVKAETVKFVYVHWRPEVIPLARKMKIGILEGKIKKALSPYHCDIEAEDAGALDEGDGAAEDGPHLTEREAQILQMLADGCTPAEVAEKLFISPKTVRNHLSKVYERLGVNSRSAAIVTALQHGLIELPG